MIWHLHTLWNDHHNKPSNHLSTHKVITILLTLFFYAIYYILIYFITEHLYLLIHLIISFIPPTFSPLATANSFSMAMILLLFVLFLDSIYKWNRKESVFLCVTYFTWSNMLYVHSCCWRWQDSILFYCFVMIHSIC